MEVSSRRNTTTYRSLRRTFAFAFAFATLALTLALGRSWCGIEWDAIDNVVTLSFTFTFGTQITALTHHLGDGDLEHGFRVGDGCGLVSRLVEGMRDNADHDEESDKVGNASEDRTGLGVHGDREEKYGCGFGVLVASVSHSSKIMSF